jgi:1,4-dihydroxy-2-naphthoate octaprenyltransferase
VNRDTLIRWRIFFEHRFASFFFGNYFYAVCVVALCIASFTQLGHRQIPILFVALAAAATVYYYNHSYLLESIDDAPNQRTIWVREHAGRIKKIQWLLFIFLMVGGGYELYGLFPGIHLMGVDDILYCCLIGLGSFLYYFDTKKYPYLNLRSYGLLKPVVIGCIWAGVGVYAPYLYLKLSQQHYVGMTHLFILFVSNALYITIIAVLFDIKDFESDANKQMKTLVVRMGRTKTINWFVVPLGALILLATLRYSYLHGFTGYQILLNTIPLILLISVSYQMHQRKSILYYLAIIDGLIVVKAACGLIATLLFSSQ